ncbi:putative ABC transporter transmembrane protein [[Actinomadura] parvosata subsp. kistnae]|uniref:Transport permease protein n=1 Tax=[Actinomadura] parvosata subsp. kistnae TaxID=1909395 RepID=A0A1V0AAG9_9ACTN|nr:ABC transporter permease [Nonomuraea sp. ATCC 55076]AQZ67201.1 multidrug ABC transporter permease [Nonomuraea sp. ATCC 55076]SPL94586.1 putative ABC transporter transmembrane protein [Actinomadura parvosata subsp. kistnae]
MTTFLRDTTTVFSREIRPSLRNPAGLLFDMGQPLLFLFLFGSLLDGAVGSSWQWFVPGILVMMCLTGPMSAGYTLLVELIGGAMERLMVTPLNRTAMLVGKSVKAMLTLLVQAVLIIVLALPLGFELHLAGVLGALAQLVVFSVGLGALSFVLAIKSAPGGTLFYVVSQSIMFPLLLLSGVLLPLETAPGWLRALGQVNPVTYVVDAQRALFAGDLANPSVLYGTAAACAVAAIGLHLGNRAMRRGV